MDSVFGLGRRLVALRAQVPPPPALPEGADAPLTQPVIYPVTPTPSAAPPIPTAHSVGTTSTMSMQTAGVMNPGGLPTTAGKTPTHFAVTNSGAATYTIPLWTPPGVGTALGQ
jgi:hypothetical protein